MKPRPLWREELLPSLGQTTSVVGHPPSISDEGGIIGDLQAAGRSPSKASRRKGQEDNSAQAYSVLSRRKPRKPRRLPGWSLWRSGARPGTRGIHHRTARIIPVSVLHPFRNIRQHVVQPPRVGQLFPDRMGAIAAVLVKPGNPLQHRIPTPRIRHVACIRVPARRQEVPVPRSARSTSQ